MHNAIEQIAQKVRSDFEDDLIDEQLLKSLYQKYNPIEDLESFMALAKEIFPKLNCGLASVYLKNMIGRGKIVNGRYKGNRHTFLLIDDLVLDITSDQYGGPKVYMGPLVKPHEL